MNIAVLKSQSYREGAAAGRHALTFVTVHRACIRETFYIPNLSDATLLPQRETLKRWHPHTTMHGVKLRNTIRSNFRLL